MEHQQLKIDALEKKYFVLQGRNTCTLQTYALRAFHIFFLIVSMFFFGRYSNERISLVNIVPSIFFSFSIEPNVY